MVCNFPQATQPELGQTPEVSDLLSSSMAVEIRQPSTVEAWENPLSVPQFLHLYNRRNKDNLPRGGEMQ